MFKVQDGEKTNKLSPIIVIKNRANWETCGNNMTSWFSMNQVTLAAHSWWRKTIAKDITDPDVVSFHQINAKQKQVMTIHHTTST